MQALEISQECSWPSCAALLWRINVNSLFSRIYCPAHCKDEPSYWAPVFGTNVYADVSPNILTALSHSWALSGAQGRNSNSLVVIPCGDGQKGVIDGVSRLGEPFWSPYTDLFGRSWMCHSTTP